jgi:hypothetical protein
MVYHRADILVNDISHLTRQTSIKQVLVWFAADINLAADFCVAGVEAEESGGKHRAGDGTSLKRVMNLIQLIFFS